MTRDERKDVFRETIDIVTQGRYTAPSGKNVIIVEDDIKKPIAVRKPIDVDISKYAKFEGKVNVFNADCLYAAGVLSQYGKKVCVLNMASFKHPGGGVWSGSAAQEENLFRRTNLFRSLYQFDSIDYILTHVDEQITGVYPLHPDFGAIYSKGVTVFRDSENTEYELRETPFVIDVVSVSAIKHPQLTDDGKFNRRDKIRTKNKIRTMLNLCIVNGVEYPILGAFGCGAYGTPPEEMAKAFKEVLFDEEYVKCFREVTFAIIDDKNSYREHNPEGNFKPFKNILTQ